MIAGVLALMLGEPAWAQKAGRLVRYDNVRSEGLAPRNLTVWLPPGYDGSDRRYPVLYMHDGQNLFDPATSGPKGEWGVDEVLAGWSPRARRGPPSWSASGTRRRGRASTCPPRSPSGCAEPYRKALLEMHQGAPLSDAYLRFLVEELKPWVDRSFRTLPGREDTFVSGSSMGGLISLYAAVEYPEVFGGAAAVSIHWPLFGSWPVTPRPEAEAAAVKAAFADWLGGSLPPPGRVRLYFDHGTETIDALYAPYQQAMDEVARSRGYVKTCDWVSLEFAGAEHDEPAWRARLDRPLGFLLGAPGTDCTTRGSTPK